MPGHGDRDNVENLFSFELLVEYIRIDKENRVFDQLALGVRLLDFPILLIYQPPQRSGDVHQQEENENDTRGRHVFNRGKSCLFKMNQNSLHTNLANTPLYAMVLDVKEDVPKLVGSSMISLANVVGRISQDVTEHGVSTPSSHGERGHVYISNLTGEKIGSISLSYKLLSLGASLLPHIRTRRDPKSIEVQHVQECITATHISTESLPPDGSPIPDMSDVSKNSETNRPANAKVPIKEEKQDGDVCADPECITTSHIPETLEEGESHLEEDLTIFCPPHLYYTSSAEEQSRTGGGDFKLVNLDPEAFTSEDSEDETAQNELEGPSSAVMHQQVRQRASHQETSRLSPNVSGEAFRQLPLLNALLVELSQLNNQNPQQPLSIHPSLAWIYRPASTEPSARRGNIQQEAQVKLLQKTEYFKNVHTPRNCSTPIFRPASVKMKDKQKEALIESKNHNKPPRKKLVYGTTKTFNLRLKQLSPAVKQRECMELIQSDTQSNVAKGKTKSSKTITKSSKSKTVLNQSSSLHENIETMIQSVTVDSAIQERVSLKEKNMHVKLHGKQDRDCQTISEPHSLSEKDLKFIHIPTMNSDSVAQNKDTNEHHSESNQSWSEFDRHREKIQSSGSSKHSSPKSSFSDSSGEGNEEAEYADDFNSLEPSDAYSLDPLSSPEPSKAKTPKSPVCPNFSHSDSESEIVQKRTAVPVPIKAPSSPQRALTGTHIIRPRTQASALSFSSEDGNRDNSASLETVYSRKKMGKSSRQKRTSGAESFLSSRSERSESSKTSGLFQRHSAEFVSSLEPQEAEELEDELGSLDLRKEYRHISELVANKLPGYTL